MISMCSSAVCGCLCGHQVRALANLPALYHVVIYRDCKRYFHDYALFLGNIDPCHIVHANRSSSWICFGCQPFYHCRSNLLMTQAHHNLHKSNVTNERLADGLFYGLGVLGDKHQAKSDGLSFHFVIYKVKIGANTTKIRPNTANIKPEKLSST